MSTGKNINIPEKGSNLNQVLVVEEVIYKKSRTSCKLLYQVFSNDRMGQF